MTTPDLADREHPGAADASLRMTGISKAFGPVRALRDVDLSVSGSEVHGLLGGNGAGKTTLMNVLYGLYQPDAGHVEIDGRRVRIASPLDAIQHGIGMVHQHFLQVERFTVLENVLLGQGSRRPRGRDREQAETAVRRLADDFSLDVDLHATAGDLPVGVRQRVEILTALYRGARFLVLDEPTTNLTPQEVDALFGSLRAMVDEGLAIVFITHKIREVLQVCDRVTVLRQGRNIVTAEHGELSDRFLAEAMVGPQLDLDRTLVFTGRDDEAAVAPSAATVLDVEALDVVSSSGAALVNGCAFQVREGEIFGIAGVAGNGQRELAEAVFGARPAHGGAVRIDGADVSATGPRRLLADTVAYVPEDRIHDGALPTSTVAENLVLGHHTRAPFGGGLWFDRGALTDSARRLIEEYDIQTSGPGAPAGALSGGNIQRVMLARAFSRPSRLLVAHNPSRGLDLPSTDALYGRLLARRRAGAATLLISEDLDELLLLCDRIGALYRGRLVGILERARFDRYELGRMMAGIEAGVA